MTREDYNFHHNYLFLISFNKLHNLTLTISVPRKTSVLIKFLCFLSKHENKSTKYSHAVLKDFCGNIVANDTKIDLSFFYNSAILENLAFQSV